MNDQRPPPAQAQAQPAQAHAQAQPPPLEPPPERVLVVTGIGFVFWVIPSVNEVTLPITLPEKSCTPLTTEAAKSDPGKLGRLMLPPAEGVPAIEGIPADETGS